MSLHVAVGRYVLVREIARGGMGTVYEALDPELKRRIAIKVLHGEIADARTVARLHREASIAARLQHPNIVAIHEVGTHEGRHFIAMDYVDGRTLADVLRERGTARAELLRMLEDVARAVGFAHARGVVHRDLKPANVLVDAGGRVLLTDFGLAHAEDVGQRLTRSQAVLGTPHYMAPEQVRGETRNTDARSDVYALGVMLYEILTGRLPFGAQTPAHLFQQILVEEPPPPAAAEADLEVIRFKAMDKERGQRYADATEFADDLARFRRGEPILARAPSFAARLSRGLRRRGAVLGTAAGVLAVAAAAWLVQDAVRASAEAGRSREAAARLESERGRAKEHERTRVETEDRARAQDEAFRHLEAARPALERATGLLHRKEADPDALARLADEARDEIEKAVARAPELAHAHYLLGVAWDLKGWADRAEECWRRAIALDARFGPAHGRLGRLLLVRAFIVTTHIAGPGEIEEPGDAAPVAEEAARSLGAAGGGPDDEMERAIAATMLAYVRRDADDFARRAVAGRQRFAGHDGEEEWWWLVGLAARAEHRMRAYDRALELRAAYPLVLYCRATEHYLRGDLQAAARDMEAAARFSPRDPVILFNRGAARQRLRRYDEAMMDYDRAIELKPDYAAAFANRAAAHKDRGELDRALADYTRALELRPRYITAINGRGHTWLAKGDTARAVADFTRSLEVNPGYFVPYSDRGVARLQAGDRPGAAADFDAAIEGDPDCTAALLNRGGMRYADGRHAEALADLNRAIELDTNLADAYANRAMVHTQLGDLGRAAADYEKALAVAYPGWPNRGYVQGLLERLRRRK